MCFKKVSCNQNVITQPAGGMHWRVGCPCQRRWRCHWNCQPCKKKVAYRCLFYYRRSKGIRTISCQIFFEFLFIKAHNPCKLDTGFRFVIQFCILPLASTMPTPMLMASLYVPCIALWSTKTMAPPSHISHLNNTFLNCPFPLWMPLSIMTPSSPSMLIVVCWFYSLKPQGVVDSAL